MFKLDPKAKRRPDLTTHGGFELDQATAAVTRTATSTTLATYDVLHQTQVEYLDSLKAALEKEEMQPETVEAIKQGWKAMWATQTRFEADVYEMLETKADRDLLDTIATRIPGAFRAMTQEQIIDQLARQEKRTDRLEEVLLTKKGITLESWQFALAVFAFVVSVVLNLWLALR